MPYLFLNMLFLEINQLKSGGVEFVNFQKITGTDFIGICPEIYLCLSVLVGFIYLARMYFFPSVTYLGQEKIVTLILCKFAKHSLVFVLLLFSVQIFFFSSQSILLFNAYVITDWYGIVIKSSVILTVLLLLNLSQNYIENHPRHLMEFSLLILLLTFFLLVLISAYNLMTTFLAIVGFSLTVYILLLYDSFNQSSREAGIKYFYLSTFSSGLLLSGIFFAYLIFHNTNFLFITWQLHNWRWFQTLSTKIMLFHFMNYFIIFGFLFKLAAFPCHLWAPEVYDGSPHPITAFFVLPIKLATLGFFIRLLNYVFSELYLSWSYIIWFSAIFSMIWGCIGALNEGRIKRFIAYSSINQMGFLFIGIACGTFESLRSTLIYLFLYIIMNAGFFIIFLTTKEQVLFRALTYITDLNDYAQKNYFYTTTFVIILFSMAGIPPLGGFFGKYYLFFHAFELGQLSLVIVGMVTSVVATYYYLRLIKIMWFEKPIENRFYFLTKMSTGAFSIYILIEFILIIFVFLSPWTFPWVNKLLVIALYPLSGA